MTGRVGAGGVIFIFGTAGARGATEMMFCRRKLQEASSESILRKHVKFLEFLEAKYKKNIKRKKKELQAGAHLV